MSKSKISAGYFRCGLPYNVMGKGARTLVVFQGLMFEHKPLKGMGHPALGKHFQQEVLSFLSTDDALFPE